MQQIILQNTIISASTGSEEQNVIYILVSHCVADTNFCVCVFFFLMSQLEESQPLFKSI